MKNILYLFLISFLIIPGMVVKGAAQTPEKQSTTETADSGSPAAQAPSAAQASPATQAPPAAQASPAAQAPPAEAVVPAKIATPIATVIPKKAAPPDKPESYGGLELLLFEEMVVVASQEAEPMHEAPVITSVITGQEIKRMGARTLNDVLLTLPGFSYTQDHNEYFCAARGIYASSQQKILVLRDGHRLNNRSYSQANFDYSISLDNVKRIEVLRGPGSSLYGDVALTAVINIVTKEGKDLDGVETTIGFGNYSQTRLALVAGKKLGENEDILVSGAYYKNEGEHVSWEDPRDPDNVGSSILYGFRDLPAYDIYFKYRFRGLGVTGSRRYANYNEPRSSAGLTGLIYDYNDFPKFSGTGPGLSSLFDHWEVNYTENISNYKWSSKLFYDGGTLRANMIIYPNSLLHGELVGKERTVGAQSQVVKDYTVGNLGAGNILFGIKAEEMEVYESGFKNGTFPDYNSWPIPILKTGKERIYAAFTQVKHKAFEGLIFNAGLRYDYKVRRKDEVAKVDDVEQFSPRAALIYRPIKMLNLRLSYSHSFVDAPYSYRYNSLPSYQGAVNLKPEELDSYQFSIENVLPGNLISQRLNIFVNEFENVIFRNLAGQYTNAGIVKSNGLEYEVGLQEKYLSLKANYTYQQTVSATGYELKDEMLENVPQHMSNLLLNYAPLYHFGLDDKCDILWLNMGVRYVGEQFARWGKSLTDPKDEVKEALICNLGFTLNELIENTSIGFHAYNVFDQEYYQGGSVDYPYLQPGRWYMAELTYKW